ncbi:MAG: hypothetical protein K2J78_01720 [Muribaculaceae bacterium]|nr:hypothetical protein [Muribaculaceae bacterium]
MKIKPLLIATAFGLAALPVLAEGEYLHVQTTAGWEVIPTSDIDKLTFHDGFMTATDSQNKEIAKIKQTELGKMLVSDSKESASVIDIIDDTATASFSFDAATKSVTILKDGTFSIHTLGGEQLLVIPLVKKGEVINIAAINSEVVIIKSGSYAVKALMK